MVNKALQLNEMMGDKQAVAEDYNILGLLYHRKNKLDKATEIYNKSLQINQSLKNQEAIAMTYGNLGNVYYSRGDLDKAIELYEKGLTIQIVLGDKKGIANKYGDLAKIYDKKENIYKARKYYQKSLKLFKQLRMSDSIKETQMSLNKLAINASFYSGGNGNSVEKAIIVNANNESLGVAAEYKWIDKKFPIGTEKISQALISNSNHFYDLIKVKFPNGTTKDIYFDITKFFGKS